MNILTCGVSSARIREAKARLAAAAPDHEVTLTLTWRDYKVEAENHLTGEVGLSILYTCTDSIEELTSRACHFLATATRPTVSTDGMVTTSIRARTTRLFIQDLHTGEELVSVPVTLKRSGKGYALAEPSATRFARSGSVGRAYVQFGGEVKHEVCVAGLGYRTGAPVSHVDILAVTELSISRVWESAS